MPCEGTQQICGHDHNWQRVCPLPRDSRYSTVVLKELELCGKISCQIRILFLLLATGLTHRRIHGRFAVKIGDVYFRSVIDKILRDFHPAPFTRTEDWCL